MSRWVVPLLFTLALTIPTDVAGSRIRAFWEVIPGVGIGSARLGTSPPEVRRALSDIPCPPWAFGAEYEANRLIRLTTSCGGAVRLESGLQVGSAFTRVIEQFGDPDPAHVAEDGRYGQSTAYWIPYFAAGIAFRAVVNDDGDVTLQSIRVMPATGLSNRR